MTARRSTAPVIALVAIVVLGALVLAPRAPERSSGGSTAPPSARAAAPADVGAGEPAPADPVAGRGASANDAVPARFLSPRWEREARNAVDAWIDTGAHADDVTPSERDALVAALGELRRAALASRRRGRDETWQAQQTARIAAADRVFRDTVGEGIADFLGAVSAPDHVVDLGATPR